MTSKRAKDATRDFDIGTNIGNLRINRGRTPVKAKHMDRCNFKEAELSNPGRDQTLESGGSEGEGIPRFGNNQ